MRLENKKNFYKKNQSNTEKNLEVNSMHYEIDNTKRIVLKKKKKFKKKLRYEKKYKRRARINAFR